MRKSQEGEAVGPPCLPVAAWLSVVARNRLAKMSSRRSSAVQGQDSPLTHASVPCLLLLNDSATCEFNFQQQSSTSVL